jgi:hypothetical protein
MNLGPTTRIGLLLRTYPELEEILEGYDVEFEPEHEMLSVRAFCNVHDIDLADILAEFREAVEDDDEDASWLDDDDDGEDEDDLDDGDDDDDDDGDFGFDDEDDLGLDDWDDDEGDDGDDGDDDDDDDLDEVA